PPTTRLPATRPPVTWWGAPRWPPRAAPSPLPRRSSSPCRTRAPWERPPPTVPMTRSPMHGGRTSHRPAAPSRRRRPPTGRRRGSVRAPDRRAVRGAEDPRRPCPGGGGPVVGAAALPDTPGTRRGGAHIPDVPGPPSGRPVEPSSTAGDGCRTPRPHSTVHAPTAFVRGRGAPSPFGSGHPQTVNNAMWMTLL